MGIKSKLRTVFRGDVRLSDLPKEALRRHRVADHQRRERLEIERIDKLPARLNAEAASLSAAELCGHFRSYKPRFWPVTVAERDKLRAAVSDPIDEIIAAAQEIVNNDRWELAGFGSFTISGDNAWRRDPLGTKDWGLDYHADTVLVSDDGADVRVLWELNRLGHTIKLAQAYALTEDEKYAAKFFEHIESWMHQNPYGRGANWACAMEVALRSMNVLAAFDIFRRSVACDDHRLKNVLRFFDHAGRFISDNHEFSYVSTSNHYLSDLIGLFWLGAMLPELRYSSAWLGFSRPELQREVDKQVLPDGADYEASTGYHRFVTELLLMTDLVARRTSAEAGSIRGPLPKMLQYLNDMTRPDGRMILTGDADGSQIVPMIIREADDAGYLLVIGKAMFPGLELDRSPDGSPELTWLFDPDDAKNGSDNTPERDKVSLIVYEHAGSAIVKGEDTHIHMNLSDCGVRGRGSHGHNDALSVELFAFGTPFLIDPGSYGYNLDLDQRHRFRSTLFHSTLMIDGVEQNETFVSRPFVMGNEASPKLLSADASDGRFVITAEHRGYSRLADPVTHRRTVEYNSLHGELAIIDELRGRGEHDLVFSFHFSDKVEAVLDDHQVIARALAGTARASIRLTNMNEKPVLDEGCISRRYGHKAPTVIARWKFRSTVPTIFQWSIAISSS